MKTLIVWVIGALFSASAYCTVEDDLLDASRFVDDARKTTSALSTATPFTTRFYQKGDRWIVAVTHASHGFVRKMVDKMSAMMVESAAPQYYEFKVVEVMADSARVAVTQIDEHEKPVINAHLSDIEIEISKGFQILKKRYQRRGSHEIVVSQAESAGHAVSGFFPVPIELPDLATAQSLRTAESGKLARYSATDLFGRSVSIEWRQGDLWPTRVRTTSAVSVLMKQETK